MIKLRTLLSALPSAAQFGLAWRVVKLAARSFLNEDNASWAVRMKQIGSARYMKIARDHGFAVILQC